MPPRVTYRLAFPRLHDHLIDVEARFADVGPGAHELKMAAWTPGSYLLREYARHVQDLACFDGEGRPAPTRKVDKGTWRVELAGRDLVARYRVWGHELTVRTNHVDGTHALVNGAPTYLWLAARRDEPARVIVEPPPGWRVTTGLPQGPDGLVAADLDELIDSPLHLGPGPVHALEAAGRPHELSVWGRFDAGGVATIDDLLRDTQAIVGAQTELFGGAPYDRYAFLLMIAPGAYGGLEHRASCALLTSPFATANRRKYEELLELVSHEYFHTWNIKRIRPRALWGFDYEREAYTRSLWVAEGITSYYDRLFLRKARVQPARRYLERLAEDWGRLQGIPGRAKQSVEESSFDAWIKLYRPDENSVNTTVSYYLKGSLVAACLDLEIRRRSGGARSLDQAVAHLWEAYGRAGRPYEDDEVQGAIEGAVGVELGDLFDRTVRGREDPPLAESLRAFGLALRPKAPKEEDGRSWLGINTRTDGGRLLVASALAGGPAEVAGLYAGDEVLALDGFRVDERTLGERLESRHPGMSAVVTVFRRDELVSVTVSLGERPPEWEIVSLDDVDEPARALRRGWLGEDPA